MPTGTIEVKPGISLSYLDSGPPTPTANNHGNENPNPNTNSEPYKTLFMLHGGSFHTPIFTRVISISTQPQYNIRFVAITRRDYPGSTALSDDEDVRAVWDGSTAIRLGTFVKRVEEILLFVKEFVERGWVLPRDEGEGEGGGFSIAGTSLGNLQGLSVLAFGNLFPDLVEKLAPYFRSYILHEGTTLFPPLQKVYHPLTDESIPKEKRMPFFCDWIASYFEHPAEGISSGDPALLNQTTPSPNKPPSQFTPEEHAAIIYHEPFLRAETFYFLLDQRVNEGILERAFANRSGISVEFKTGSETETLNLPIAWPDVPVRSLYGDKTSWTTIFTQRKLERWVQDLHSGDADADPKRWIRRYEPNCVEGANHFLYWDNPDKFLEMIKRLMV